MDICIGHLMPGVYTLGPGRRIALWVKGCSLGCEGCMSPELLERTSDSRMEVASVFQRIQSLAPSHTGVTITGGEPLEQPDALRALLVLVRRYTTLDVMLYSGYTLAEVLKGQPASVAALDLVDVLIDGRYRQHLPTARLWRGSANQGMHLLSERAHRYRGYVEADHGDAPALQVEMTRGRGLHIIGIPREGDLSQLRDTLHLRGIGFRA